MKDGKTFSNLQYHCTLQQTDKDCAVMVVFANVERLFP